MTRERWSWLCGLLLGLILGVAGLPLAAWAAPGLCIGPVCGDEITRSSLHHFQLRLRLSDQQGHRERITVDCRNGQISPSIGPVERGHAVAIGRKVCRLAGEMA